MKKTLITIGITLGAVALCIGGYFAFTHLKWESDPEPEALAQSAPAPNNNAAYSPPERSVIPYTHTAPKKAEIRGKAWYSKHAADFIDMSYTLRRNLVLEDIISVRMDNKADNVNFTRVTFHITYTNKDGYDIGNTYVEPDDSYLAASGRNTIEIKKRSPEGTQMIAVKVESAKAEMVN